MSNSASKINLNCLISNYPFGILIPEIQRDYVMGAGGKGKSGKDRLKSLLEKMNDYAKNDKEFDFSCIITHYNEEEKSKLEIYDGQQRLTTLIFLYLYLCKQENKDLLFQNQWLTFSGRPIANSLFSYLAFNDIDIKSITIQDFTSFSIKNLLIEISNGNYESITSDFLLNKVVFDMVSISSQNEIEQFFMDLNSGVQLKDYEIYKAKLNYIVDNLKKESLSTPEWLKTWSYKLDNEWLNYFSPFASFENPEEEYEIAFIKYCINMTALKYSNTQKNRYLTESYSSEVDLMSMDSMEIIQILEDVFNLMQNLMVINLENIEFGNKLSNILKYTWGDDEEEINVGGKNNYDKRGAFWSLDNDHTDESILYYIIKNVLLDGNKKGEMNKDVFLWHSLTTLNWNYNYRFEYLRNLKVLLNNNVFINEEAWYECQNKGQYLYYCKYIVHGIPQYYGKHMKDSKNHEAHEALVRILYLDFWVNKLKNPFLIENINPKQLAIIVLNDLINLKYIDPHLKVILQKRLSLISQITEDSYLQFIELENHLHGILKKFNDYREIEIKKNQLINEFYASKVRFGWPSRSDKSFFNVNGNNELVYVLIKCFSDKLFEESANNDFLNIQKITKKLELEKIFWMKSNSDDSKEIKIYKLINRATWTSSTYNICNSNAGWAYFWSWDGNNLTLIR